MSVLHADIESFSEADLKRVGAYRYAEDPSTEITLSAFAFDDEDPFIWTPLDEWEVPEAARSFLWEHICSREVPARIRAHVDAGLPVHAHNAPFERTVLNRVAGKKINFPELKLEQMVCTSAMAAAASLPRDLDSASKAAGTLRKDESGKKVMLQLCKLHKRKATKKRPASVTRMTLQEHPEKFRILADYCVDDVLAERALGKFLPMLPPREREVWRQDQIINERGICVDIEAVHRIMAMIEEHKLKLANEFYVLTALKPTQTKQFKLWLAEHDIEIADLKADTVKGYLDDEDVFATDGSATRALEIYSVYNSKAVSKFKALAGAAGADGRVRGMFIFWGANTGRWSSSIVQLQNIFRGIFDSAADADRAIEDCMTGDLAWVEAMWCKDSETFSKAIEPMKIFASCTRGMLRAAPGKKLVVLDYSGVESRGGAWLAGEDWKLRDFFEFDEGRGYDNYIGAYARAFKIDPKDLHARWMAGDKLAKRERLIGKVLELAMQYKGGVGAFVNMSKVYYLDLDEMAIAARPGIPADVLEKSADTREWMKEKGILRSPLSEATWIVCDALKRLWRDAHPATVAFWADLENNAKLAVLHPGRTFKTENAKIAFRVVRHWLCMRLPSGRLIRYFKPLIVKDKLTYYGINTYTRQWGRVETQGGKLLENAAQGLCRDPLADTLFRFEDAEIWPVGHVHDEAIAEVECPDLERSKLLMCKLEPWAEGFPLVVGSDSYIAERFRK